MRRRVQNEALRRARPTAGPGSGVAGVGGGVVGVGCVGVITCRRRIGWPLFVAASNAVVLGTAAWVFVPSAHAVGGWSASVPIGAVLFWIACAVLLNFVREMSKRLEIDAEVGEIRTRGVRWFRPWWRMRYEPFAGRLADVRGAECDIPRRGEPRLRAFIGDAVLDIPWGMTRIREAETVLRTLGARHPEPISTWRTRGGTRDLTALIVVLAYAAVLIGVIWSLGPR